MTTQKSPVAFLILGDPIWHRSWRGFEVEFTLHNFGNGLLDFKISLKKGELA